MTTMSKRFHPKVLFVASEIAPWIKTGGLADVAGALPHALHELGVDVRVLVPAYPALVRALAAAPRVVTEIPPVGALPPARLLRVPAVGPDGTHGPGMLLVDCPALYDRPGNPYLGADGKDWPDNDLRFGQLSRVAALLGTDASPLASPASPASSIWRPDVIHCNDWQSALAPVYLAQARGAHAASVMTVHNLAYQGLFPMARAAALALAPESVSLDRAEYYGQISFLKGGLACADAITTVSPTYAREIRGEALGFGLQGLLSMRTAVLHGILNGIDTAYWNPATDPYLAQHYDADTVAAGKAANKRALQAELGLPIDEAVPVLGTVGRLVAQKGFDLIVDAAEAILATGAQIVLQGTGDAAIEARLQALAQRYPDRVAVRIAFDERIAHCIEAGSDMFLMPSRFEPCGLNQMYSLRYGTLPIVCRTGGLADSVTDCTPETIADGTATGFVFHPPSAEALAEAAGRAIAHYRSPAAWRTMQRAAMARDFSWTASARRYVEVYRAAMGMP